MAQESEDEKHELEGQDKDLKRVAAIASNATSGIDHKQFAVQHQRKMQSLKAGMSVVETMSKQHETFIASKNQLYPFAQSIEGLCQFAIESKGLMQLVFIFMNEIYKYKPTNSIMTAESQKTWNTIHDQMENIIDATDKIFGMSNKFFSFLLRFQDSASYMTTTQCCDEPLSMAVSTKHWKKDIDDFTQFVDDYKKQIEELKEKSLIAIQSGFRESTGGKDICNEINQLREFETQYIKAIKNYEKEKMEIYSTIYEIEEKIASEKSDIKKYDLLIKFAQGSIENKNAAMTEYQEQHKLLEQKAKDSKDTRQELWTKTTKRWLGLVRSREDYYKNVWTGDQTRLQKSAERYKNLSNEIEEAKTKAETAKAVYEAARVKAEKKIEVLEKELKEVKEDTQKRIGVLDKTFATHEENYENAKKKIEAAINSTSVGHSSVGSFLKLTNDLGSASLDSLLVVDAFKEQMNALNVIAQRSSEKKLRIESYLTEGDRKERPIFGEIVKVLKENDFIFMDDLTCEDDEEYDEILQILKDNKIELKGPAKKHFKRICKVNDKTEWIQEQNDLTKNGRILATEYMPFFCEFLGAMHKAVQHANDQLKLQSSDIDASGQKAITN